jgi:asparagine synthase (glutamine-hydrolysing)
MCRIFGYLGAGGDAGWLTATGPMLRHGGPDACHLADGPGWGLGVTRLAITDPAGGAQPYRLRSGIDAIQVVFNGEIYNHEQLRDELRGAGYRFADRCDGSILPALYHRYGPDFARHLDGMYAIAVLDRRAEPTLTMATDETGMKSLYYCAGPDGGVHFASELPPLLALPHVDRTPRLDGLDAYLATRVLFGEDTMFEGVRVLPPGAVARCTASSGLRVDRRPALPEAAPVTADLAGAGRAVRTTLRAETHRLISTDTPLAAICSGGLDSSLVTALLAERLPGLEAFHIGYAGDWPMDEHGYAAEVAARAGVRLHRVTLDPYRVPDLLPEVVGHLGQPNADPITVSTFALFRAVREHGFKVALTGDGADEMFGGYDRFRAALSAGDEWRTGYLRSLAACPEPMRRRLYSADYRDHLRHSGGLLSTDAADPLASIRALEIGSRLPAYHLRRVDHLSMASGVEARLPFCQPAVVRQSGALPPDLRFTADRGKRALYAAAEGLLPRSVLDRPKQPFTLPVTAMLTDGGPLLGFVREVLAPDEIRHGGQLDPTAVQDLLRRHGTQPTDTTALALWALTVHQVWLRRFVLDARPTAAAMAVS